MEKGSRREPSAIRTLKMSSSSLLYAAMFVLFILSGSNPALAGTVTVIQGATVNWGDASDAPYYTGASTGTYQTTLTGQNIAGPITFLSSGSIGTLSLAGASSIGGAIGSSTSSLNLMNINGAAGTVTLNGASNYITTTNFVNPAAGAILSLAPGITLNGSITTSNPGIGIVQFQTTGGTAATINGNIGGGNALAEVDVYQGSSAINGNVTATNFAFKGNGGNVSIAAGDSITTANPITVAVDGASTITYLGTTTIGSDLGSSTGNKFAYINFNGGTVTLGANIYTDPASQGNTGTTTVNGATLNLTGNRIVGGSLVLENGGSITGAGEMLTMNGGGSFNMQSGSVSAILDGAAALNKTTSGTLTLSGANTYTGDTKISSGTLVLGNNLALQNSALDTSGAGVITATGFTTPTLGGLKGSTNLASVITTGYSSVTALTLNPGTGVTDTYSGAIANGAAGMTLTKSGLGTQVLSGTSTYTGSTAVNQGTLELNGGKINNTSSVSIGSTGENGALQLDTVGSSVSTAGNITIGNSTGNGTLTTSGSVSGNHIYLGNDSSDYGTMTIYSGGTVTSSIGYIGSSAGSLINTVNVNGSNAKWTNSDSLHVGYSGTGILAIANGGAVSNVFVGDIGTNSGSTGTVTVDGTGSVWTDSGTPMTVGLLGTGTLTVSNSGTASVGGGTGVVTVANSSGSTGTLNIGTTDLLSTGGTVSASTVFGGNGTAIVNFNQTDSFSFAPILSGSLSVNQKGSGVTTLSGANTYTAATTVTAGTLKADVDSVAGTSGPFGYNSAVTLNNTDNKGLDINGHTVNIGSLNGVATSTINLGSGRLFTGSLGTTDTYGGAISGTGGLTLNSGTTGSLTLTHSNNYTGFTEVDSGTLVAGNAHAFGSGALAIASSGKLDLGTTGLILGSTYSQSC